MTDELRPCPFCGGSPQEYYQWSNSAFGTCNCGAGYRKNANQNAWCWKEIDKLKLENKRLNDFILARERKRLMRSFKHQPDLTGDPIKDNIL